ncbi:MAG TPA: DUF4255 domain-containing protein [Phycisphaerae bacterium]|nr:DUF4255 domain-containing protein [Phycisphaerae bacterium]
MSTAAAIAAVTASIQNLLNDGLQKARGLGIVAADAKVTSVAPDRLGENPSSSLVLFLYDVSPNTGWANQRLPSRDTGGSRIANPYLALDLCYMLTAYGNVDCEAELLLGHAMQALHETPGLTRDFIRTVLDPGPPDGAGNPLPQVFRTGAVNLAEQIELIKITPKYLSIDDLSKIWASLQCHYRPSTAYQVTVVLIEAANPVGNAPPVLRIGALDRGPVVQANMLPPFPTLIAVVPPAGQAAAPISGKVSFFGHHLAGTGHRVVLRNPQLDVTIALDGGALNVTKPGLSPSDLAANALLRFADTRIDADLSKVAAGTWRAGVYSVSIELTPNGSSEARATNSMPLAIAPSFATSGPDKPVVVKGPSNLLSITLTTSPMIAPRQGASVILGSQEIPMSDIAAPTNKPVFQGVVPSDMLGGPQDYLARLRVAGVESQYIRYFDKPIPPEFDPTQRITIP